MKDKAEALQHLNDATEGMTGDEDIRTDGSELELEERAWEFLELIARRESMESAERARKAAAFASEIKWAMDLGEEALAGFIEKTMASIEGVNSIEASIVRSWADDLLAFGEEVHGPVVVAMQRARARRRG